VRFATFNAGLATGVLPYVTERLPHVVRALSELDVDVLFVQEFWLDAHWDELVRAAPLTHVFRAPPAQPRGACTREELAPLEACVDKHCKGLRDEALARCVVRHCARFASTIDPGCVSCITSNPVGTFEDIVAPCIGTTRSRTSIHAYGGSYGTGLLSKTPLEDGDVLVFDATLNARCALYARTRDIHIVATHLSPGIVSEQHRQIDAILARVDQLRGPVVILGDLNTSPRVPPHVSAHNSELYRRFTDAGFVNPFTTRATYGHGSLTSGAHGDSGWVLDHILLRGLEATRAERILDQPLAKPRTTLSDHCGVLVELAP
jgi:endonuclease/exonuclease/phosphatase family metal-dependent hydrolase